MILVALGRRIAVRQPTQPLSYVPYLRLRPSSGRVGVDLAGEILFSTADSSGNQRILYFAKTSANKLLFASNSSSTDPAPFVVRKLVGAATASTTPSGGGGPSFDTQTPATVPLSTDPITVTMPRTLGSYLNILIEVDIDLHLGGSTDIHQVIFPVYPQFMMGSTGTIETVITKSGGAGGIAVRLDQADFTATATTFDIELVQLLSGASLTSSFRVVKIQGIRFGA